MGDDDQRIKRLRELPLFSGLQEDSLARIASMMSEFEAPAGRVLVQPNLPGSGLFIIEDGTVAIKAPHLEIERGPGECVGEVALLTDRGHSARVQCKTDVKGFAIARSDFKEMLEREPKVALSLLEIVATRLAETLH